MKKDRVNSGPAHLGLMPAWAVSTAGGSGTRPEGACRAGLPPRRAVPTRNRMIRSRSSGAGPPASRPRRANGRKPPCAGRRTGAARRRRGRRHRAAGYQRPPSGRPPSGGPPMKLNLKTLLIGGVLLLVVFVIMPRFFGEGDAPPPRSRRSRRCSPNRHSPRNPAPPLSPSQRSRGRKHRPRPDRRSPRAAGATACRPRPQRRPVSPQRPQHRARRGR